VNKSMLVLAMVVLAGCVRGTYHRYSWNTVPTELRRPPTREVVLISKGAPQLDSSTYKALGKVNSFNPNYTAFEKRCLGAVEMLRDEAQRVGADAVINIECGESLGGSYASGTAIRFTERR